MADISTIQTADGLSFDWALAPAGQPGGGDLAVDTTLRTAVIISLFTDRLAAADDPLPDGTRDRRGWWGDLPLSGQSATTKPIGSRLWLLSRATASAQTARRAKDYCAEALQWLIDDGVAASVAVTTQWLGPGALGIGIAITEPNGALASFNFAWAWNGLVAGV